MAYDVLDVCRYAINYSNEKNYTISNLKLQKLLYFIQAYFLVADNKPCFNEKIEAWDFGPVVPEAYHEFKEYAGGHIPTISSYIDFNVENFWDAKTVEYDNTIIKKEDKKQINSVIDLFSDYSATDLLKLTHDQSPWINAYVPRHNNEITQNSIQEYFSHG